MRIALATMMDDNFLIGFKAFIKSFLYHNPWFDYEFLILDVGLSENSKAEIKEYYKNVLFRKIDYDKYREVNFERTNKKLQKTYYTLDVFNQCDFDRIVFIDMDTVVLADISFLFECPAGLAAVQAYDFKQDKMRQSINSGVFVVNREYINGDTYRRLIRIARRGYAMPDQKVINKFFNDKIDFLPKAYNVEKRMLHTQDFKDDLIDIKILHFVASKPWETDKPNELEASYGKFEKIWWVWNDFDPKC